MGKLKPLLPTLREKKRYIRFSWTNSAPIKAVTQSIEQAFLSLFGSFGAAKAGVIVMHDKYDEEKKMGIARVNHKYVDQFKAALAFVTEINKKQNMLRSVQVSGVLKKV